MLDFTPSEKRVSLRELAYDFAASEARSIARDDDRAGTWPQPPIDRARPVGLMDGPIPQAHRGDGPSSHAKIMQLCAGTYKIQPLVIARATLLPRRIDHAAVAV